MTIPIGIVGASGLVGGELLRLLDTHPDFRVVYAGSSGHSRDAESGPVALAEIHPHLLGRPVGELRLDRTRVSRIAGMCAAVFLATPPVVSASLAPALLDAGVEVVADLSAAFRIKDPVLHKRWYPDVSRPWSSYQPVYGLPELNRDLLPGARLISVPGCLATASILALYPLSRMAGTRFSHITIDAKAGSAGSGTRLRASGLHALRSHVVAPYAPTGHRHVAEIRECLTGHGLATTDGGLRLGMSAYGVDLIRGASVAVYVWADDDVSLSDLTTMFRDTYQHERFVRVIDWRSGALPMPDPKAVIGSNYCDIAPVVDTDSGRLVIISVLDTLTKGAAGQAIQACNKRFGWPEDAGLNLQPVFPA
ncbi:MAG TPA: N-acetyl-gamma-glutamyl-phosphate reductase [Streptosporangiaceae bacterium]|nr:N-acetyl-gamma-glutamyl-phosphate reductase [Streptosporangiaceae bacterium]